MFKHQFSENKSIEKIINSFLEINIEEYPVKRLILILASKYDERYKSLQPTYALFSSQQLRVNFEYIIVRLLEVYNLSDEESGKLKKLFWDMVERLIKVNIMETRYFEYDNNHLKNFPIKNS